MSSSPNGSSGSGPVSGSATARPFQHDVGGLSGFSPMPCAGVEVSSSPPKAYNPSTPPATGHPPVPPAVGHPPIPPGSGHSSTLPATGHPSTPPATSHPPAPQATGHPPAPSGTSHIPVSPGSGHASVPPGTDHPPTPPGIGYPPVSPGIGHPYAPSGTAPVPPGMGYPPVPVGAGYPPVPPGTGHPPIHPGAGYPPIPPGTGHPPIYPGAGYPPVPPGTGHPPVQSGYPGGTAPYPLHDGFPGGLSQPQGAKPIGFSHFTEPGSGAALYPGSAPSYPLSPAPYPAQPIPTPSYPPQHASAPYLPQHVPGATAPFQSSHIANVGAPVNVSSYPTSTSHPGTQAETDPKEIVQQSSGSNLVKEEGTLKPFHPFNGQTDAEALQNAMKGFGVDEKIIINVLARRTNDQRQKIIIDYKTMYGKDLLKALKSALNRKLEDVILALMMTSADYDATSCLNAISGLGTDEDLLIEILCTRTNAEILAMKKSYKIRMFAFQKDLEKDIKGDTRGHFQNLLVSLATGGRDESLTVDMAKAQADAQVLYKAGKKKLGTDESKFNSILAAQSFPQLRQVFKEYQQLTGDTIEKAVISEMSDDLKKGMLAIINCVHNKADYFAKKLYKSMKGAGTNDRQLIRVVVTRCEKDMVQIKKVFQKKYGKTLESFIKDDTSGEYKRILLALVT